MAILSKANLNGVDLSGVHLNGTDLSEANLSGADLSSANLNGTDLSEAILSGADLSRAKLSRAKLSGAILDMADLSEANLSRANLNGANLNGVDLSEANLSEAILRGADLLMANLNDAYIGKAKFQNTKIGYTLFTNVDLSDTEELITIIHTAPSSIGIDTLIKSKGKIPAEFLRQCGLSPWEIELARLYDPDLSAAEISEIISVDFFQKRTQGPLFIGGIFISYSHEDSKFVDKLYNQLKEEGAAVWLDRHDMVAGEIKKQVINQIRIMDVMVIVLSEASTDSDWVETELEIAREKEKLEKRSIICPVALDDSWKAKIVGDNLWRQVAKYNILDFLGWKTKKFDLQFQKLFTGIKKNYAIFYK